VSEDSVWLVESPVTMVEGEQIAFSVQWLGAARVSEAGAVVFKNTVDITDAAMAGADAHVVNGNVVTLKKLTAAETDGGARYVLVVEADVDGNREKRKLLVKIVKLSAES
jgi:hypothetical protein